MAVLSGLGLFDGAKMVLAGYLCKYKKSYFSNLFLILFLLKQ